MSTTTAQRRPAAAVRRRPVVGLALAELHGPSAGVVTPPRRLWWSGTPEVNLSDLGEAAVFYEAVLDAGSAEDQAEWLNGSLLAQLWPSLGMLAAQRAAWEALNPQLGGTGTQAATAA